MKRELLIGCGHAWDKRVSVDGAQTWHGLVTLDANEQCQPDLVCRIGDTNPWSVYRARWNDVTCCEGADAFAEDDEAGTYLKTSSFDEVHAYEVLEHLGQQGNAFAFFQQFSEIWRILKPGGFLCATVPSRFSPWLWADPSHTRAILPETLVFLDQSQYIRQLDGPQKTAMSDFRSMYRADFKIVRSQDNHETHEFILQAVKPSRWVQK